ncbi:addiction module protein [Myxococcota bacterium]|nr:addiction module protein [Myxococcota bacterium]
MSELREEFIVTRLCPTNLANVVRRDYNDPMEPSFDQMTPAERILHVQSLWDRIAEEPEGVPVSDEMKAELDRRLAAHRAEPSTAIPWEQVKAELRRRR